MTSTEKIKPIGEGPKFALSVLTRTASKASRLLFAAVLAFFVYWTPLSVLFLLRFGCDIAIPVVGQSLCTMFTTFSAWIIPVIYGALNPAMRKEFRNILIKKVFCRKVE